MNACLMRTVLVSVNVIQGDVQLGMAMVDSSDCLDSRRKREGGLTKRRAQ